MDIKEWLQKVAEKKDLLLRFVRSWHPASNTYDDEWAPLITAEGAEQACAVIRKNIATTGRRDLEAEWNTAYSTNDTKGLYSLMNSAWFGVPESTSCWNVKGFREAVELLKDPPEIDYDPVDPAEAVRQIQETKEFFDSWPAENIIDTMELLC